jgi:hypothetical protein
VEGIKINKENYNIPQYYSPPAKQLYTPYGITFEDEHLVRKDQKIKYREDLDYLVNLRKQYGDNYGSNKEDEEFKKRVQYLNDVKSNFIF